MRQPHQTRRWRKCSRGNHLALLVKVKGTLAQALRLCTGCTARRGSKGIAPPFLDHHTRRGEGSASRPGCSLPPGKTRYPLYRRLGGPMTGLHRCGKALLVTYAYCVTYLVIYVSRVPYLSSNLCISCGLSSDLWCTASNTLVPRLVFVFVLEARVTDIPNISVEKCLS